MIRLLTMTMLLWFSLPIQGDSVQEENIHHLYEDILSEYVKDGLVDYAQLKEDKRLSEYIKRLSNTDPDSFSSPGEQLAFWINTYNAYTLKVICDNYPIESINDLNPGGMAIAQMLGKTVWHKDLVVVNQRRMSLNDVEHEIIRKKFNEPRAHFALVCGALSCPDLRREAYEGGKLDAQLDDQAKRFLNNKEKNRFDLSERTAYLSRYFDWYDKDFGNDEKEILLYVAKYLPSETASAIKNNPGDWKVEFVPYNWCLNKRGSRPSGRCVTDWDSLKDSSGNH